MKLTIKHLTRMFLSQQRARADGLDDVPLPAVAGFCVVDRQQGNATRAGTSCWTWNGSVDAPTLRPSVLTQYDGADRNWRCHSWINDGAAQFLEDCSHSMAGQTAALLDVDMCEPPNATDNRAA